MTLNEINKKFGTDKGGKHCYLERYYEPTFSPIRESTKKLLEIGVYEGASIRLWREYFSSAEIFALEILQKRAGMFNDDPIFHHDNLIGNGTNCRKVMGDEHIGEIELAL